MAIIYATPILTHIRKYTTVAMVMFACGYVTRCTVESNAKSSMIYRAPLREENNRSGPLRYPLHQLSFPESLQSTIDRQVPVQQTALELHTSGHRMQLSQLPYVLHPDVIERINLLGSK